MPAPPQITLPPDFPPTTLLHHHPSARPTSLLLLLPGNPGLATYYTHFLRTLAPLLPHTVLVAASHAGFTPAPSAPYYPLHTQVALKLRLLRWLCEALDVRDVVLIAHSMGAWLALEIVRALAGERGVRVRGVVGLFPTVMDIAQSAAGRAMGPWLRSPLVARVLGGVCGLLGLLPARVVEALVGAVTRQEGEARETTRVLVTSAGVVRQALRMAGEEMEVIRGDVWGDEVWHGSERRMVFLFAQRDQWVAEETMRKIEATRGGEGEGKVRCVFDQTGLPHGFCTERRHSETVARLVAEWVGTILQETVGKA